FPCAGLSARVPEADGTAPGPCRGPHSSGEPHALPLPALGITEGHATVPAKEHSRWHIAPHNGARSDNRAISDANAGENDRPCPDRCPILDDDRELLAGAQSSVVIA